MNRLKLIACVFILTLFVTSCSNRKPLTELQNKSWDGDIFREGDNQKLSAIKIKFSGDTAFVFSNAIFGAANDTLTIQNFNTKDSVLTLTSAASDMTWRLKYAFHDGKREGIALEGTGFYAYLLLNNADVFSDGELSFYRDIDVPQDPDLYLFGAYEGEVEFENPMINLFTMGYGGTKIKLVFSEGFKVKSYGRALFFNSSEPETSYYIEDNKIYAGGSKQGLSIVDHGRKLVFQTDKLNLVLRKIY